MVEAWQLYWLTRLDGSYGGAESGSRWSMQGADQHTSQNGSTCLSQGQRSISFDTALLFLKVVFSSAVRAVLMCGAKQTSNAQVVFVPDWGDACTARGS